MFRSDQNTVQHAPTTEEIRILVVDDEASIRETLADVFDSQGYITDTAATGDEALGKVHQRFYNVALLDILLPRLSGTELLARIRELHPETMCIMATGHATVQTSIRALHEGAFAYVIKPLDVAQVLSLVRQAIDKQRLARTNRQLLARLQALEDVTDTALSTQELDERLTVLLGRVVDYLHANAGAILLLDGEDRLVVSRSIGLDESLARQFSVRAGEGFSGQVVSARQALVAHEPELYTMQDSPYFRARGVRSVLGVPLLSQGRLVGVAHVDWVEPHEVSPEDIRLFEVLAERSAALIDNARLYWRERQLREEMTRLAERAQRSAEQANSLAEVAQALVASLEMRERLAIIAGRFAQVAGTSRCVLLIRDGDALVPRATYGVTPQEQERLKQGRLLLDEVGPELRAAWASGQPVMVPDARSYSDLPRELVRRWGLRSALIVPLMYGGTAIGAASMDDPGQWREFTADHVQMAQAIASLAAVAIQTSRTFEAERDIAQTLQKSLLSRTPFVPGFDICCQYVPASDVAQVGGDYFDFIELGNQQLGVVIADVCGKGLTAAVYTAMAKYMLQAYALEDPSPARVLTRLNQALYNQMSEACMFITMVYGVLDLSTGAFSYANAAHPYPLLLDARDGRISELPSTGGMVGAVQDWPIEEQVVHLGPGSVLALFTDGVTEARQDGEMLESSGVATILRQHGRRSAREIAEAIYRTALEFSDGQLRDDVAIVVMKAVGGVRR